MKQKEQRRFVWVDWLILLALLLGGVAVAWRIRHSVRTAEATQPIVYTLAFSAESELPWESLMTVGATLTTAHGTATLGEIASVEERPLQAPLVRDGRVVFAKIPDRVQLVVTVKANAVVRDGDGIRVGDIRIAADGVGDFRIGSYLAEGARVLSVQKEE